VSPAAPPKRASASGPWILLLMAYPNAIMWRAWHDSNVRPACVEDGNFALPVDEL